MCGIAGQFNYQKNKIDIYEDVFERMQNRLERRGPDQKGMYIYEHIALIHSRLAVIDIDNGTQPMCYSKDDEDYVIVYNGELYNTEDIRKDLMKKGHRFISHSDTEVLLHCYVEYKERCVDYLNGIYAFAIWEKNSDRIFLARDRIGVKPLFYVKKKDKFIFASEIKALLVHPEVESSIDVEGVAHIMLIGPGRTPGDGVFRGIEELKPGEYMYIESDGSYKKNIYWQLVDREHTDNFEQTVEKVRFLVVDSVKRQLVSDVKVCTFLSGGLDSSIISAIADKYYEERGKCLDTVSVCYKNNEKYFKASKFQPNSDEKYIKQMADCLYGKNHLIEIDNYSLVKALYEAVDARDLPGMVDVDSSLLLFCREIKKIATVGLSGECADEIFGGYPWYRDKTIRERYGFPWAQSTEYRASFIKDNIRKKINPFEYVDEKYKKTLKETDVLQGVGKEEIRMKQMINLNFKWFMQTLLDRKDRMSMYSSLEVRVPFCDYRIAEYMYSVPWEYKDYKGMEKGLLREAMKGVLPEEILWRKKSPYPKTHNPLYRQLVSDELRKIIDKDDAPLLQLVKKDKLLELLETTYETPWYGQLMTTPQTIAYFVQINYWLSKYNINVEI